MKKSVFTIKTVTLPVWLILLLAVITLFFAAVTGGASAYAASLPGQGGTDAGSDAAADQLWVTYADISWYSEDAGVGTITNPYRIDTPEKLAGLAQLTDAGLWDPTLNGGAGGYAGPKTFSGKYIWVTSDIDLSGGGYTETLHWTPIGLDSSIGDYRRPFLGTLDCGIYTNADGTPSTPSQGLLTGRRKILNMRYSSGKQPSTNSGYGRGLTAVGGFLGLLAEASGAAFKNAEFANAVVESESSSDNFTFGTAVGVSYGEIDNVKVGEGSAVSLLYANKSAWVGGIVGKISKGSVTGSENHASVKGSEFAGGIAGYIAPNGSAKVYLCHNYGSVSGVTAGGIVGGAQGGSSNPLEVLRNGNSGTVTGIAFAGGIVAETFTNSINLFDGFNVGTVYLTDENDAGMKIGGSVITKSGDKPLAAGGILGGSITGNSTPPSVFSCYSAGTVAKKNANVSAEAAIGGIAGVTASTTANLNTYFKRNYYTGAAAGIGSVKDSAGGVQNLFGTVESKTAEQLTTRAAFITETLSNGYVLWDFKNNVSGVSVKNELNPLYTWRMTSGGYPEFARENVYAVINLDAAGSREYNANEIALGTDFSASFVNRGGGTPPAVNQSDLFYYRKDGTELTKLSAAPRDAGSYRVILYTDDGSWFGYSQKDFTVTPRTLKVAPKDGLYKI
ncbi:MAG: hypothetical protein LBC13_02150, partial [Clostridiales bacterium]|nr:hypothetical protein [Clostridiales bacterium]